MNNRMEWTTWQKELLKRADEVCKFLHTEPDAAQCVKFMEEHDIHPSGVPSAPQWQLMRYVGLHISKIMGRNFEDE